MTFWDFCDKHAMDLIALVMVLAFLGFMVWPLAHAIKKADEDG